MKRTSLKATMLCLLIFSSLPSFSDTNKIVYGLKAAQHLQSTAEKDIYIQVGSFFNLLNAQNRQEYIQSKINYPVEITNKKTFYSIRIGPIHSAEKVRAVASMLSKEKSTPQSIQPTQSNWFAFAAIGGQGPQFDSAMHVNNGSSFAAPYNQDEYTVNHDNFQPMVAVFAGKRWQRDSAWLPAYSIGARYESLFTTTVHGSISQYTLPEFKNYDYSWNIVSNLLFASAKVNLYQYKRFLPYITAGLGGAFNRMSNYEEKALPGVTPRFTPGFQDRSQTQLAYHLGAGLDVQLTQGMLVSLAYQYMNLGQIKSGYGTNTWSNQLLDLGSYRSNGLFLGATYVFPQHNA